MRKLITIVGTIIVTFLMTMVVVNADIGFCGDNIKWILDSNGTMTISGTGDMWEFSTSSPAQWDESREYIEIKKVIIEEGITSIGTYAFYSCDKMTSITIPSSITTIGNNAFYDCGKTQITVDDNNEHFCSVDGVLFSKDLTTLYAYAKDKVQSEYQIPDGVTTISSYAFGGCSSLSSVTLPNSVTHIKEEIFEGCNGTINVNFDGTIAEWNNIEIEKPNTVLLENITFPNSIYISGDNNIEVGATSITQDITYSSSDELEYLIVKLKYPSYFTLDNYKPIDFQFISKDSEITAGDYTIATFTCQYSGNSLAPKEMMLMPFEMTFNIASETPIDTYIIALEDGTEGIDKEGNSVSFKELAPNSITIVPERVKIIEIEGGNAIYETAEYSVNISPITAYNKAIIWEVSDTDIATISQEGVLAAKKNGTVTVTAKATDGSGVIAQKEVTVYAYAKIDNLISNIGTWDKEFAPKVRRYIIYVDDNIESITLTPSFMSGILLCDGALWINNRSKEFALNSVKTTIHLERKNVDEYEDGVYTITVVKGTDNPVEEVAAIGDYYGKVTVTKAESDDKITLTVTSLEDIDLSGLQMYVAEYNNGVLRDIRLGNNTTSDNSVIVTADSPISSNYKIMLWDSKCCPVIGAIIN